GRSDAGDREAERVRRGVGGPRAAVGRRSAGGPERIVLTGRFVSDGWIAAHVRPLALAGRCGRIWVVTDRPMLRLPKTTYVCPPRWLQRVLGPAPSRSLYCVMTAVRCGADWVGGFHFLLNGVAALAAARLAGARAMYFCVGGWTEIRGGGARSEHRLFHRLGRDRPGLQRRLVGMIRGVDLTLTMGRGARRYLEQQGVGGRIHVMPGGIDAERFCPGGAGAARRFDMIFVGRLVPIKRMDVLLRVVARVAAARPGTRAVIVGDGPLRAVLEAEARRLGIRERVSFVGHQSDVASWVRQSRVFVLTSDSEGLPLSVMEAMACGLPVVVSDVGDVRDIVEDGVNGYCVPRRDVEAFASRIVSLIGDGAERRRFGAAARRSAMVHATESVADRWDVVLGGAGRGRASRSDMGRGGSRVLQAVP
ncbi:MAG: glycosyltransferase, partial [Phycisphaerae bacterium]